jgi:thiol-disulfide isomerase/thioredoxin
VPAAKPSARSSRSGPAVSRAPVSRRRVVLALLAVFGLAPTVVRCARPDAQARPWPAQQTTPALALPSIDGTSWSLAAMRGQVVVINFWASWCEPCREEMPSLELLATLYQARGLRVVAVNFRETDAAVQRFVQQTGLDLPVARDRDGAAAQAFGVRVFPTTIVIGRNGRAAFSVVGEVDWTGALARSWIEPLLDAR